MSEKVLSERTLNRTLLHRQRLLERSTPPLPRVVEQMGGIQMQYAPAGYVALWSRMRTFERAMLTRALEQRDVVQGTMMRATIHTVSAADYWPMIAGIRRVNREWYARVQAGSIGETDMRRVADAVREELDGGPMRVAELARRLADRGFPERALSWAQTWVELVRVPPSGTWERRRADLYGLAETWLPPDRDIAENEGIEHLVRRYLGAFGPASLKDIATWMGMNVGQMRHVAEAMELRPSRDEDGRPLFDLGELEVVDGATAAPPRFLPVWDATLLVHARRTQILPEAFRPAVFNTKTPHSVNTFLLDGQVAGTWRFEGDEIRLEPLRGLHPSERAGLEDEAAGLAALHR